MIDVTVVKMVTIGGVQLERYVAYNYAMNLLKSSLKPVRQIGYDIALAITRTDVLNVADLNERHSLLEDLLLNGNPA